MNNTTTVRLDRKDKLHIATKKVLDRIFVLPLFLLSIPIILPAALLIKLFSPGSAFFVHERVGYKGQPIRVWKLRTMHSNSQELLEKHLAEDPKAKEEWKNHFKLKNDPRIIPFIGKFLRVTSMDELPQLWNILKGDMSLVGPRPFPEYHLAAFSQDFRDIRQQVMPGLTGLWQVSARSNGDISVQERLDREYIEKHSLLLDTKILLKTAYIVLARKGAC